ncbi:hypothetical protein V501_05080 [Pseudogymnoascus sp. VKM F-4519 (FW-2642)]|nr:hypothetical protein V501_05080 [Pseudogymnoascus sp. VKM F-4519 (FW-2642)]
MARSTPWIPLTKIEKQDEETQVPTESPATRQARRERRLNIFSILLAVLIACAITGGTTYALADRVKREIANDRGPENSGDRARWMLAARTKVYHACYNGCDASPSCTSEACAKTAALNVTGVVCDANVLWDQRDRYPAPCLEAVAEMRKREAFGAERKEHLNFLSMMIFIVPGGTIGGLLAYGIFWCWVDEHRHRKLEKARQSLAAQPRWIPCYRPPPPLPTMSGTRTGNTTTPLKKKVSPPLKAPKKMAPHRPSLDQLSLETLINGAATPTPATTPSSASTLSTSTGPTLV